MVLHTNSCVELKAFHRFTSEGRPGDESPHSRKTEETLYHNKVAHRIYEENKKNAALCFGCGTPLLWFMRWTTSLVHPSTGRCRWWLEDEEGIKEVKLQTYADSFCPQWPWCLLTTICFCVFCALVSPETRLWYKDRKWQICLSGVSLTDTTAPLSRQRRKTSWCVTSTSEQEERVVITCYWDYQKCSYTNLPDGGAVITSFFFLFGWKNQMWLIPLKS